MGDCCSGGIGFGILKSDLKRKRLATAQTSGVITALNESTLSDTDSDGRRGSKTMYTPEFTYSVNGEQYVKSFGSSSSRPRFKVGDPVTVLYDPGDPNTHIVKEDWGAGMLGPACLFTGVFMLAVGTVFYDYFW